jgi:hypothetical protein
VCEPEIIQLPASTETENAAVHAMNDSGLVGGMSWAWDENIPPHAVVWQDAGPPIDIGIGGTVRADGSTVVGGVADVNESGVVAATRSLNSPRGAWLSSAAMLWDETAGATRLPAPPQRPKAIVAALNDLGVAVGSARGRGKPPMPVYWRGGEVTRLPMPPKAEAGSAIDNNNRGLIVGHVDLSRFERVPWWWRRGHILSAGGVRGMDDARHLAGTYGGFRGFDDQAWVAKLGAADVASLPNPPIPEEEDPFGFGWDNTTATAVATGITAFAPQGGVTVGGYADRSEGVWPAVLWTCAQTYLQ